MTRHTGRTAGTAKRNLLTWLAAALLIYWIAREPAQAAAVFHGLTTGFADFARHLHHGRTATP